MVEKSQSQAAEPVWIVGADGNPIYPGAGTGPQPASGSQSVTPASDSAAFPANVTQVGGVAVTLGQKTMAASIPVTLASDGSYATAANQAGGTAGTPAGVIRTVQGINGGTAVTIRPVAVSPVGGDRSATLSTTSSILIPSNTNRIGFYVKNDTAIDIWINVNSSAVAAPGNGNIKVPANGGYYESNSGWVTTGGINAVAASGTPAITAREF